VSPAASLSTEIDIAANGGTPPDDAAKAAVPQASRHGPYR